MILKKAGNVAPFGVRRNYTLWIGKLLLKGRITLNLQIWESGLTLQSLLRIRAFKAGVAQLVEHDLAKVGVASSSLVSRSTLDDLRI